MIPPPGIVFPPTSPAQLAASHGALEQAIVNAICSLEIGVSPERVLADLRASRDRAAGMRAGVLQSFDWDEEVARA